MNGVHGIAHGDVLEQLRGLPDNSFDGSLSDPPYGFRFMGKRWDYDVPSVDVWRELLRVLKPGAPLLSFGGARTYHRVAVGIEDAGFELRDEISELFDAIEGLPAFLESLTLEQQKAFARTFGGSPYLQWVYGSGMPKTANIPWLIDKAAGIERKSTLPPVSELAKLWAAARGTALKPAHEPIVFARKPLDGTLAENVAKWGCGGIAIDACAIGEPGDKTPAPKRRVDSASWYTTNDTGNVGGDDTKGLWPANLVLTEGAADVLDAQTGELRSHGGDVKEHHAALGFSGGGSGSARKVRPSSGGPSRFFYHAKVSTKEREYGCEQLPKKSAGEMTERVDGQVGLDNPRAGAGRGKGAHNHHPTLKPLALTRWLARLIMPPSPDAQLLVPYSGAGSEMIGALQAGWPLVLGIEGEADYIAIAHARIEAWRKVRA